MREFKFRVWHKKERRYLGRISFLEWFEDEEDLDMKDIVVQQYTNLKDKNGREIYEGDILQYTAPKFATFKAKDTTESGLVIFDRAVFWCNYPLYEVVSPDWNCIIIGNIYEYEGPING